MPLRVAASTIPVGSAKTNNIHVKRPVRYPYLSFEEFHDVKPHHVLEARSCIYTVLSISSIIYSLGISVQNGHCLTEFILISY